MEYLLLTLPYLDGYDRARRQLLLGPSPTEQGSVFIYGGLVGLEKQMTSANK
jgi:hypothetical protein